MRPDSERHWAISSALDASPSEDRSPPWNEITHDHISCMYYSTQSQPFNNNNNQATQTERVAQNHLNRIARNKNGANIFMHWLYCWYILYVWYLQCSVLDNFPSLLLMATFLKSEAVGWRTRKASIMHVLLQQFPKVIWGTQTNQ